MLVRRLLRLAFLQVAGSRAYDFDFGSFDRRGDEYAGVFESIARSVAFTK